MYSVSFSKQRTNQRIFGNDSIYSMRFVMSETPSVSETEDDTEVGCKCSCTTGHLKWDDEREPKRVVSDFPSPPSPPPSSALNAGSIAAYNELFGGPASFRQEAVATRGGLSGQLADALAENESLRSTNQELRVVIKELREGLQNWEDIMAGIMDVTQTSAAKRAEEDEV